MTNKKNGKSVKLTATVIAAALMCAPLAAGATSGYASSDYSEESSQGVVMLSAEAEAIATSVYSSIPSGAYAINVNINGRRVLSGRVFNTGGVTYVPMFAFSDWIGAYSQSYNSTTATATLTGTNLKVTARAGDYYIVANDRYFYTGAAVMLVGNEICVPILPMVKALNSHVTWSNSDNCFYVRSGDSRLLANGAQVYNADQVYWLARIISAEAKGEPMKGKIAVGNVVLNRMRSPYFPNSIYGVIFDTKYGVQFSPVANGTIYNTPTVDSIIAAKMCLEGYSLSSEVLYFLNPSIASSSWITNNRPYAFTIGKHAFFE